MEKETQLAELIRKRVSEQNDPSLYLTEDDVYEMALDVLTHSSLPVMDDPGPLIMDALKIVWDEIPGVEIRGTYAECF